MLWIPRSRPPGQPSQAGTPLSYTQGSFMLTGSNIFLLGHKKVSTYTHPFLANPTFKMIIVY